ncbi:MAG: hypothetical protein WBD20_00120 [Pirellulaceae bacterium]
MSASPSGPTNCRIDPPIGDSVVVPLVKSRQRRLASAPVTLRPDAELGFSASAGKPLRSRAPATSNSPVQRRVDRPHVSGAETPSDAISSPPQSSASLDREAWLKLHAAELIRRLQTWANGLDAREASLNAACARQDLRERQFRLKQAEFQAEMDDAQQDVDDLRRQIAAQSRRLAFQSLK